MSRRKFNTAAELIKQPNFECPRSAVHIYRGVFVWQGSDGGAIYVETGASATFDVPGGTSFEGNTVEAGYSGGVLYAGGEVSM